MLKGNVFTIYIHSNDAAPKRRPQRANCQLVRSPSQKVFDQLNAGIRIMENFSNT